MITKLAEIDTLFTTFEVGKGILDKISIWKGDITKLEIDVIVNAANAGLRGGGGVDGAIHDAAGWELLQKECRKHGRCKVGSTVATSACNLTHVKSIFHTVGPQVRGDQPTKDETYDLVRCYASSLELAVEEGYSTIAFPCISTGIYGYPNNVAAKNVINYLYHVFAKSKIRDQIERVVLCLFLDIDVKCYRKAVVDMVEYIKKNQIDGSREGTPSANSSLAETQSDDGEEAVSPALKSLKAEEQTADDGAATSLPMAIKSSPAKTQSEDDGSELLTALDFSQTDKHTDDGKHDTSSMTSSPPAKKQSDRDDRESSSTSSPRASSQEKKGTIKKETNL